MSERDNDSGARKSGIGARLQAGRERADLSLVQAAELLHVDPNVIHALESENFSELGAAVYARGHLRHYAELVRESAPELLGLFAASVHAAAPPDLTRMPHAKQSNPWRGAVVMTGVALVIGVGLIGSIHWLYLDLHAGRPVPKAAPVVRPGLVIPPEPTSAPGPAAAASNS
ncbi:MAG TPA: helix-turn-helix domain-containing protein [Steroidobacteraceae bacterium]